MPIRSLVFVCAGNICRSPMAEAFFRREAVRSAPLRQIDVGSAGTIALDGHAASPDAVEVMRDAFGLDISGHRAQRLTRRTVADLLLTLDHEVTEEVKALGLQGQIVLLGDYAGSPGESVDDPYMASRNAYESCASQLARLVEAAARRLEAEAGADDKV